MNGDLVIVRTKSGRSVTTTLSHSHLMRKDHQVQPVKGCDLRVGMRIPVCQHIDNKFVNMTVKDNNNREYPLDDEFGTLVGKYLAHGSVQENKRDIIGFLQ